METKNITQQTVEKPSTRSCEVLVLAMETFARLVCFQKNKILAYTFGFERIVTAQKQDAAN